MSNRALVVGDGISARAAYDALKKLGYSPDICDKDSEVKDGYDFAVVSPGIEPNSPFFANARAKSLKVIGEVELGYLIARAPIIAITGTNGKTTTTRLVAAMTHGAACGNIGVPLSEAAFFNSEPLVAEVSSFQLCTVDTFHPKIACILNITPDHLNYHKTFERYAAAKCAIARNMDSTDALVIGGQTDMRALSSLKSDARVYFTGKRGDDSVYVDDGYFYFCNERICAVDRLRLRGEHNVYNALAAIAIAKLYGADNEAITDALTTAVNEPHRIEQIAYYDGRYYFDDSKSTNVASTLAAAKSVNGLTALILGGSDKGEDFDTLAKNLPENVCAVAVMGATADAIERAIAIHCKTRIEFYRVKDVREAVRVLSVLPCENIMLSPSCASFDSYKDYRERGADFCDAVACYIDERMRDEKQ